MYEKNLDFDGGFWEGHNTAARNIKAGLDQLGGDRIQTQIIDAFEAADSKHMALCKKYYLQLIQSMPWGWKFIFNITHRVPSIQNHLKLFKTGIQIVEKIIERERPDIVCSTYPLYPNMFKHLKNQNLIRSIKKITVITDSITIHSSWLTGETDFYIVPNEDTQHILKNSGIEPEKILPFGFPVQSFFADPSNSQYVVPMNGSPSILYIINGHIGSADKVLQDLLAHPDWKITVLVGRDEKLKKKLLPIAEKAAGRAKILGWCSEVPRMLFSHHLLICKAGGAIVQESIAARCPMVVNHIVPGQEEGNYLLLKKNNCCALAQKPGQIAPIIERALSDNARQWREWKNNLEKFDTQDSSLKIADFLLKL